MTRRAPVIASIVALLVLFGANIGISYVILKGSVIVHADAGGMYRLPVYRRPNVEIVVIPANQAD